MDRPELFSIIAHKDEEKETISIKISYVMPIGTLANDVELMGDGSGLSWIRGKSIILEQDLASVDEAIFYSIIEVDEKTQFRARAFSEVWDEDAWENGDNHNLAVNEHGVVTIDGRMVNFVTRLIRTKGAQEIVEIIVKGITRYNEKARENLITVLCFLQSTEDIDEFIEIGSLTSIRVKSMSLRARRLTVSKQAQEICVKIHSMLHDLLFVKPCNDEERQELIDKRSEMLEGLINSLENVTFVPDDEMIVKDRQIDELEYRKDLLQYL